MRLLTHPSLRLLQVSFLLITACAAVPCVASHLLQCDVTYAGLTHKLKATPTQDPYSVPAVDIGGRFFFKMVLTEQQSKLEHVLIYAYLDQQPRPVLLQQAKYSGPFLNSTKPYALTGEQRVYGGPVERELIYSCWLSTTAP